MDPELSNILDKESIKSILSNVKFLDTDNGSRNNILTDPLKTVEAGIEDIEVPEEYELKTVGAGPNQREIIVKKDRPKNINRFLAGFIGDAILGRDWDRQGGQRHNWAAESPITGYGAEWNDETKKKIIEKEGKADLSGDALPSREEFKKRLELNALQKQAQRLELAKDAELNNVLVENQIQNNMEALYPYLLRSQLDAQNSPYGQTIIRGRAGDLSASMKDATSRQLREATLSSQAGLQPRGIRYASAA
jgi:hypothetical protein